ncbi:ABC transporter permease [Faecalicatena orotica]|uniref:ABC transporter permease n=2 Tax=Bacillota TaxID=1239 RepID=UPI0032180F85
MAYERGGESMKRFWTLYKVEQKLGLRCPDMLIFGVGMPVGVLVLIAVVAGNKTAGGSSYTFLQSAFASLMAVGICASAFMGIPLTVADYRDKKILKHFFVTPCTPMTLMSAIVACSVATAVLSGIAVSVVAAFVFQYRMKGSPFLFICSYLLVMTAMYSIGVFLAGLCKSVKMANVVTTAVYFPMLFLSGATIPFELFPKGMQTVASVLPLTQGIKLMKQISMGDPVENAAGIIILMIAITVICSLLSKFTFRWE